MSLVALWVALAGGLHLDGLAACCDGLLAPFDAARRLTITADPWPGAFVVIGLTLFLAARQAGMGASFRTGLPMAVKNALR